MMNELFETLKNRRIILSHPVRKERAIQRIY